MNVQIREAAQTLLSCSGTRTSLFLSDIYDHIDFFYLIKQKEQLESN